MAGDEAPPRRLRARRPRRHRGDASASRASTVTSRTFTPGSGAPDDGLGAGLPYPRLRARARRTLGRRPDGPGVALTTRTGGSCGGCRPSCGVVVHAEPAIDGGRAARPSAIAQTINDAGWRLPPARRLLPHWSRTSVKAFPRASVSTPTPENAAQGRRSHCGRRGSPGDVLGARNRFDGARGFCVQWIRRRVRRSR